MDEALEELYRQMILDHSRRPRNFRHINRPDGSAHVHNDRCGDDFDVNVRTEDDVVVDAAFTGAGCAISTSAASLLTESLRGRRVQQARDLLKRFNAMLNGENPTDGAELGKLSVFTSVRQFPSRVPCATLACAGFLKALEGD